jgi:hypothetical protein
MRAILGVLLVALLPVAASAQVAIDGRAAVPVPATLEDTTVMKLYQERTGFELETTEVVNYPAEAGTFDMALVTRPEIAAGQTMSCYLVHYQGAFPVSGTITFGAGVRLLGIVGGEGLLERWDAICAPPTYAVAYPTGDPTRGSIGGGDIVTVRADLRTIDVTLAEGTSSLDQLRILVDEGGSADAGAPPARDGGSAAADAGSFPGGAAEWDYRGSGGCTCSAGGAELRHGAVASLLFVLALAIRRARRARD